MNAEIKSNDKQSSTMNYLSKKAGELYGKVIKFEDKLFAGETEGITLKAVGCLARGIGLVSGATVKYVKKVPFGKKKEIEEILGTEEPEKAAPAAEADAPEEAHVEEAAAPKEEAAAPKEKAAAPKEKAAAPKEKAKEEALAEYTLEELQEKTKAQLLEIVEELGVPDVAAWRPKNEIIDQIIEFQEEEE